MTAVAAARGLAKRYGRRWALPTARWTIPAGHVVGLVGPERRRQDDAAHLAVGMLAPTAGTIEVSAAGRPAARPSWPRSASSRRTPRRTPG